MSITVSFKTEDDLDGPVGPVVVIDHDLYDKDPEIIKRREGRSGGAPFGYQPAGMTNLGWKSRRQALAIARQHGVTLQEW